MAAICGVDWQPLTARELHDLHTAVQIDRWDHTAFLVACQMTKSVHPWRLNPYRKQSKKKSTFTGDDAARWHDALMARASKQDNKETKQ
jgi:hypothetical protein